MARLDRLGQAAKYVAQTGAAIGREFSFGLLTSTTDLADPQLRKALDRLTGAGLLFVRGTLPESSYMFKHALVQDAAYGTLLRSRRLKLHSRIAATLEDRFPEVVLTEPALLAQHFASAGLAEKAIAYWLKAGQRARSRWALTEAISQLRKGLALLADLPEGPQRRQHELDLLILLQEAMSGAKGISAPEVGETLGRARKLAEDVDQPEPIVLLMAGQWHFHLGRSEHKLALTLGKQMEKIGAARRDMELQLVGCSWQAVSLCSLGEFVAARASVERYRGLPGPTHRVHRATMFEDPYALLLGQHAMTLAYLGYVDEARSQLAGALLEARRLKEPST